MLRKYRVQKITFLWCHKNINLQFLRNVIIIKAKVPPQAYITLSDFGHPVYALCFYCCQTLLNYFAFQSFDFERT